MKKSVTNTMLAWIISLSISPFCWGMETTGFTGEEKPKAPLERMGTLEDYGLKIKENLFFNVVPINEQNFQFWKGYATDAVEEIGKQDQNNANQVKNSEGMWPMVNVLYRWPSEGMACEPEEKVHVFVVYATDTKVSDSSSLQRDNIEMSFLLMTNPGTLWTTHLSISRSPFFKGTRHKNLSPGLHAYGAQVARKFYPYKTCMITVPVPYVRNVFINLLPQGKIWVGDNLHQLQNETFSKGLTEQISIDYENYKKLFPSPIFREEKWTEILDAAGAKLFKDYWYLKEMFSLLEKKGFSFLNINSFVNYIFFNSLSNKNQNIINKSPEISKSVFELRNFEGKVIFTIKAEDALWFQKYNWFLTPSLDVFPSPSGNHSYVTIDLEALSSLPLGEENKI